MRIPALLVPLFFLLSSCTTWDLSKGTGTTFGDSIGFEQTYGANHISWASNAHTPVWDAAGRFVGNVTSGAAEMFIASGVGKAVAHGAVNGVQLVAATLPAGIQKTTSRKTNRSTPRPVLVTPAGKVIKPNIP